MSKLLSLIPAILTFVSSLLMRQAGKDAANLKHKEEDLENAEEKIKRNANMPKSDADFDRLLALWADNTDEE